MGAGTFQHFRLPQRLRCIGLLSSIGMCTLMMSPGLASASSGPAAARSEPAGTLRYHALLIGTANHDSASVNASIESTFPAMAQLLREQYGFQTTLLRGRDASVSRIESALRANVEALSDSDLLLIVYAGRTERDPFLGESYWVLPADPADSPSASWARHRFAGSRVLRYIEAMNARHILLVHEGELEWRQTRGVSLVDKRPYHPEQWYVRAVEQPSRMILIRPLPRDAAQLRLLPALVDLLQTSQSPLVSGSELFLQYRDRTGDGQLQFARLYDGKGSLQGEFVFHAPDRSRDAWARPALDSRETPLADPTVGEQPAGGEPESGQDSAMGSAFLPLPSPLLTIDPDAPTPEEARIENLGCQHTVDSIAGQAIRFERRAYLRVRAAWFRELAAGDFTIALWMKSERTGRFPLLSLGQLDRGVGIECNGAGFLSFSSTGPTHAAHWGTADSFEPVEPQRWYHLAFTKRGNRLSVVVDGIPQSSFTADYTTFSPNSDLLYIGRLANVEGSVNGFDGVLDELQFFDRALDPQELKQLHAVKYQRFAVSTPLDLHGQDLDRIAQQYYGGDARVAEWNTLKTLFATDGKAFLEAIGLGSGEVVQVRVDGQRFDADERSFGMHGRDGPSHPEPGSGLNPESDTLALTRMEARRGRVLIRKY